MRTGVHFARKRYGRSYYGRSYSLAICADAEWNITPPETCDAIRNAATTAGTLINLKN
jgi:hypothetical protein